MERTIETSTYPHAMAVIRALRDKGMEAGITTGGVWVRLEDAQLCDLDRICKELGVRYHTGASYTCRSILGEATRLLEWRKNGAELAKDAAAVQAKLAWFDEREFREEKRYFLEGVNSVLNPTNGYN